MRLSLGGGTRIIFSDKAKGQEPVELNFEETDKVFDPKKVYGDAPNPTQL